MKNQYSKLEPRKHVHCIRLSAACIRRSGTPGRRCSNEKV